MRRLAVLLAIAALLAAPAVALAKENFSATLTTDAEVPAATGSEGSGSATVTISDDESQIEYEVTFENLTGPPAASHIHFGAAGVAGPVILPLEHGDSPFSGTLTEADFTAPDEGPQTFAEALEAMRAGDTYINVHTEANPPGEIRGQLEMVPDTATAEVPAAPSTPILLLALVGLAVFLATLRRFSLRRA
jgi:hypothetical protein